MKPRIFLGTLLTLVPLIAGAVSGTVYPTPEAAKSDLIEAVGAKNKGALITVLGSGAEDLVNSGDPVYDDFMLGRISKEAAAQCVIDQWDEGTVFFNIGPNSWQLPIPLVKTDAGWVFNPAYDKDQIIQKRVRRNEASATEVCRTYVQAQRLYAERDRNANGVPDFAQKIISSPGTHDGLYWPQADPNDNVSPLWPLVEKARHEGYGAEGASGKTPYRGYYYRILTAQGPDAPGGAMEYIADGKMTKGFALIGWPAKWGNSGVNTFIVNQSGRVWRKDLGERTDELASKIDKFNPDSSWQPANY